MKAVEFRLQGTNAATNFLRPLFLRRPRIWLHAVHAAQQPVQRDSGSQIQFDQPLPQSIRRHRPGLTNPFGVAVCSRNSRKVGGIVVVAEGSSTFATLGRKVFAGAFLVRVFFATIGALLG